MKRLWLLLCPFLLLSACGGADRNGVETFQELRNVELTVFADSSLSDICRTLAEHYRDAYPGIRLRFQFGSSSALLTRVRDGADCDLFVSASDTIMDALDNGGFVSDNSRVKFLENRLVLAVPDGNPRKIRSFAHMASLIRQRGVRLAAANIGDPLGAYTQKLFSYHSLNKAALSRCVSYALDAKETVTRIRADMVDGGIVYRTDADGLDIIETADAFMTGDIVYSAAVLSESRRPLAAMAFLEYLTGPDAAELFTNAGFTPSATPYGQYGQYWESLVPGEDSPADSVRAEPDPDAEDGFL
ncbi:MAG: molybdate ABC transporter substrate-binding protein [Oscillospiraceae bacterium]|nr:molybdate ABC transporter substrate-binding protein [Oscillospiraceae bacterium]